LRGNPQGAIGVRWNNHWTGPILGALGLLAAVCAQAPPALGDSAAAAVPGTVDKVVVLKGARRLMLLHGTRVLRTYRIALGRTPQGAKAVEGDGRTPEGRYVLDWRNPRSRYHRSIHVSYPNDADRARARQLGLPPGGDIMIHGLPEKLGAIGAAHARWDWTEGCVAVSNAEMDEIWTLVADGTVIDIRP
jgi:murein L,D-transpeptidase YafK